MSRKITIQEKAKLDAIDIAYYIAEESLSASDRFTDAINTTFELLAEMPGIGASRKFDNSNLKDLRMLPVRGFEKILVFYFASEGELRIVRILHSSRDIATLFEAES